MKEKVLKAVKCLIWFIGYILGYVIGKIGTDLQE